MLKKVLILPLLILALLFSACSSNGRDERQETVRTVNVNGGSYQEISITSLEEMLEDKDFTFINVHIPFEGDIPGTDLSIPYNQIEENLSLLPADKDAKIVLYCRSDRMSTIAAKTLVQEGYTNVWNVLGGMVAWERAGLPLEGN
jgi:rhodanese-related sulfurtransferase